MAMYADAVMNLIDPATPGRYSGAVSLEVGWGIVHAFKAFRSQSVASMQRDWQTTGAASAAPANAALNLVTVGGRGYAFGPNYPTFASAVNAGRPTTDVVAAVTETYQFVDDVPVVGATPATCTFASYNQQVLTINNSTFGPTLDPRQGNFYFDGRGVFGTSFSACTLATTAAAAAVALTPLTGTGTGRETQIYFPDAAQHTTVGIDLRALPINSTFSFRLVDLITTSAAGGGGATTVFTIQTPVSAVVAAGGAGQIRGVFREDDDVISEAARLAVAANNGTLTITNAFAAGALAPVVTLQVDVAYSGTWNNALLYFEISYLTGAAVTTGAAVGFAA